MKVPDPLPLRTIEVPAEVTQIAGCDCGGTEWHRTAGWTDAGWSSSPCSIWRLPHADAMAAIEAAQGRLRAFTAELNAKLRAALGGRSEA